MPQVDYRARLQPKSLKYNTSSNDVLGPNEPSNILYPLWATRGVLFPYAPEITTGTTVEYDQSTFVQTNYNYNAYIRSYPKTIDIKSEFTAQTTKEAMYLLAVIHFFRSVTKSYFGINPYEKAGTPPPTLIFNYLGEYQFNNVPVIIKDVSYSYPNDIDYVEVRANNLPQSSSGGWSYVPARMAISLTLDTQYVPIKIRNEFNLDEFRRGRLLNKGYI
jgi:hypothetical protein